MIRVLHIVGGLGRGGLETFIMNVYRNIDRSIIQFDFLKTSPDEGAYEEEIKDLGGRIYSIQPRRNGILNYRKELNKFFEKHKEYKIVHQHVSSLSDINALKIAKKNGVPIRIIHSHSTNEGSRNSLFKIFHYFLHNVNQKRITTIANDFFACSEVAAEWILGRKLYERKNFKIIYNGIETELFKFDKKVRDIVRNEFNVENDEILIGNVGSFHHPKNHEFLIDIFHYLVKVRPKAKLLLVGDGKLRNHIENKVKTLDLDQNVIFTGIRKDVSRILQGMDLFLMPSLYEGFPVSVIEAQCAGLPCLLSDTITKETQITDLVKYESLNNSPEIWANKILDMIRSFERADTTDLIKEAGFDAKMIAEDLTKYYLRRVQMM